MSVEVTIGDDFVAVVEFENPPNNFFNAQILGDIADAYEQLDADPTARAVVLSSRGRNFCAGADFGNGQGVAVRTLYEHAYRIFDAQTPVVAAVQGAAVGGGLGLALSADFRIATPRTRFHANFARLGLHHGFGMTVSLPRVVGDQTAAELLLAAPSVRGEDALRIGLCDQLASDEADDLRDKARAYAAEIAANAPLAVRAIRTTLRGDIAQQIRAATEQEAVEQVRLFATADFKEGVRAASDRRQPTFSGE
jgi:2-(1,2-epoxy-1,2-dihydrophenyl)acetyl-CoA isomerase